jgi:Zn-dependent metalloprotease
VTGVGIQDVARILYHAMLRKTSTSNYRKYRTWTLAAAKELHPGDCRYFHAVKAAWNAVSVPPRLADPTCT